MSILELLEFLKNYFNLKTDYMITNKEWRLADQRFYVSNIDKITKLCGWEPSISLEDGLENFSKWIFDNN
jgi:nucleoside-diphosphate-sugar epimerase